MRNSPHVYFSDQLFGPCCCVSGIISCSFPALDQKPVLTLSIKGKKVWCAIVHTNKLLSSLIFCIICLLNIADLNSNFMKTLDTEVLKIVFFCVYI